MLIKWMVSVYGIIHFIGFIEFISNKSDYYFMVWYFMVLLEASSDHTVTLSPFVVHFMLGAVHAEERAPKPYDQSAWSS